MHIFIVHWDCAGERENLREKRRFPQLDRASTENVAIDYPSCLLFSHFQPHCNEAQRNVLGFYTSFWYLNGISFAFNMLAQQESSLFLLPNYFCHIKYAKSIVLKTFDVDFAHLCMHPISTNSNFWDVRIRLNEGARVRRNIICDILCECHTVYFRWHSKRPNNAQRHIISASDIHRFAHLQFSLKDCINKLSKLLSFFSCAVLLQLSSSYRFRCCSAVPQSAN